MTHALEIFGGLFRAVALVLGALFLIAGNEPHAWFAGIGILLGAAAWDVATIAQHSREQTVLLTAIAERE